MARTRLERLHRHRLVMEVAVAEGLSLDAARDLLIERRRAASERAQRAVHDGRLAQPPMPVGAAAPLKPQFWWEKI